MVQLLNKRVRSTGVDSSDAAVAIISVVENLCRKRYMTRLYHIRDSSLSGQMPPAVMKRSSCNMQFDVLDRCVMPTGEQSR